MLRFGEHRVALLDRQSKQAGSVGAIAPDAEGSLSVGSAICCRGSEGPLRCQTRPNRTVSFRPVPLIWTPATNVRCGSIWPVRQAACERPLLARSSRPVSTYCGHCRPRPWTSHLGGEPPVRYPGWCGKNRTFDFGRDWPEPERKVSDCRGREGDICSTSLSWLIARC